MVIEPQGTYNHNEELKTFECALKCDWNYLSLEEFKIVKMS